jgi:hypothetical protein
MAEWLRIKYNVIDSGGHVTAFDNDSKFVAEWEEGWYVPPFLYEEWYREEVDPSYV